LAKLHSELLELREAEGRPPRPSRTLGEAALERVVKVIAGERRLGAVIDVYDPGEDEELVLVLGAPVRRHAAAAAMAAETEDATSTAAARTDARGLLQLMGSMDYKVGVLILLTGLALGWLVGGAGGLLSHAHQALTRRARIVDIDSEMAGRLHRLSDSLATIGAMSPTQGRLTEAEYWPATLAFEKFLKPRDAAGAGIEGRWTYDLVRELCELEKDPAAWRALKCLESITVSDRRGLSGSVGWSGTRPNTWAMCYREPGSDVVSQTHSVPEVLSTLSASRWVKSAGP